MKKPASQKWRLLFSKNFILMLVMLVVIIMTISAWFTLHKTVTANTMKVEAESTEIDIAHCVKTYDSSWNVLTDGPGEFGSELTFSAPDDFGSFTKDCTGDGKDLIVPDFNVTNDYDNVRRTTGKDVNINVSGDPAVSQEFSLIESLKHPNQDPLEYQYMEFEFYVRSKNPNLRLSADSVLKSETEADNHSLTEVSYTKNGATIDKKSAYSTGNNVSQPVNVDGLVGAIRVALIGEACNRVDQHWIPKTGTKGEVDSTDVTVKSGPVKQILWYPRPDIKLIIPDTKDDISNWSLSTGLTERTPNNDSFINSYYKRKDGADGLTFVSDDEDSKTVVSPGVSEGIPTLGQNINISDFSEFQRNKVNLVVDSDNYTVKEDYYVTKYTLRVWIEGTDSEARRAMDGGKFNLSLKFT